MASRRKRQKVTSEGAAVTTATDSIDQEKLQTSTADLGASGQAAEQASSERSKPQQRRSLFVRSLPPTATTQTLTDFFSQSYPLKHATIVVDPTTKESKGYGFVTFADAEDARKAREQCDGTLFEGRKLKIEIAEPRNREITGTGFGAPEKSRPSAAKLEAKADRERQKVEQKAPKLIVRNLPWSIKKPEQLALLFRSYGKVKHVTLPQKKPGLLTGFGFVTLRGRKNAENALEEVNGKELDGRTLAVDWAVDKQVWTAANQVDTDPRDKGETKGVGSDVEDAGSLKLEDGNGGVILDEIPVSDAEHEDLASNDESDHLSHEDNEDSLNQTLQSQSSTLFIRNLPFTTVDEALHEHFSSFGPVRYARVVIDNATERSKGTGFVCFYNSEDANGCLRGSPKPKPTPSRSSKAKKGDSNTPGLKRSLLEDTRIDETGQYTLEGRVLQISRAVDRKEAGRLTLEGKNLRDSRDKDKRRLYLLSEGTVPSGSPLYDLLAPSEVRMREDSAKQRQTLIKSNPSLHLSLTRLSVRNLPRHITSKDLKALAREAVVGFAKDVKEGARRQLSKEELARGGDEMKEAEKVRKAKGKGIVRQAKIVFEGKEGGKVPEGSGAGRSRGYGFIEYVSHRWALMGLRWLNGHLVGQRTTGSNETLASRLQSKERGKRLIVEFAIENAQVVTRRRERESRARDRPASLDGPNNRASNAAKHASISGRHMAKSRNGTNRKRGIDEIQESSQDSSRPDVTKKAPKEILARRQQIIGKKRLMRKARRNAS
ncbi:RNA recognition motif-containing protein [Loxospora ochrophaea]|nr:RNA recognition motif-containing protein [Loxospora ochrophaea]